MVSQLSCSIQDPQSPIVAPTGNGLLHALFPSQLLPQPVGANVGDRDGNFVGDRDGNFVGDRDGDLVVGRDGTPVGERVGVMEGLFDGFEVGTYVTGESDGPDVG